MYHQIIDEGEESTKAQAEQHLFVADITNNIKNTPVSATAATPHIHDTDDDGANISSSCLDFPPTVLTILIMETAERFAYYGFRAVLVLYFTDALGFSDGVAISLFAFTTSFATLMPVFGAIISDGYLGKYRTIVIFGCVYIVGISVLTAAAYVEDVVSTFIGLSLICIGTGGIKPCVSPFGADQLIDDSDSSSSSSNTWSDDCEGDVDANATSANDKLVQKYFTWFYFCINLGSLASFLLIPSVRAWLGFGYAFLIPAIFIVVSMLVFVSKKSEYRIVTPNDDECSTSSTSLMNVFRIYMHMLKQSRSGCCSCCFSSDNDYGGEMIEDSVSYSSLSGISQQEIEDAKKMARVLPVLATFPVFWMLYDQTVRRCKPKRWHVLETLMITFRIEIHMHCFCIHALTSNGTLYFSGERVDITGRRNEFTRHRTRTIGRPQSIARHDIYTSLRPIYLSMVRTQRLVHRAPTSHFLWYGNHCTLLFHQRGVGNCGGKGI